MFGVFMPQGWKMELSGIDGAAAKWNKAAEIAVLAEQLGYDSIWLYDHFHNVPRPAHEAVFECWTTMAAISQRTSRVRLGQMVGCNSYREPGLLAKITSTLDVISGGRLDWGIGAGWYENEYRAYGYDFPKPSVRFAELEEVITICRLMWTEAEPSFAGKYFAIAGASAPPLPDPVPRICIGASGEQIGLPLVGRLADMWNGMPFGTDDDWRRRLGIVRSSAEKAGRDPDVIEVSMTIEKPLPESDEDSEKLVELLTHKASLGVQHFVMDFGNPKALEPITRFAEQVMAPLRAL